MKLDLTIGQKIAAGFAAIVIICVGLGLFSIRQLHTIAQLSTVTTTGKPGRNGLVRWTAGIRRA